MDVESRIAYSAIIDRPRLQWPNGANIAFWVCTNVLFFEYEPPSSKHGNPWARTPIPDNRTYALQDYGSRVAFWRVVEVLDAHRIRSTASLSLSILDHFPEIRDAMVERNWELMPHGLYNTRVIYDATEEEEREYLRSARDIIHKYTGAYPAGALAPGPLSSTARTPDLLAEEDYLYAAEWSHDDQPFPIAVKNGPLISVPYSIGGSEVSDIPFLRSAWEASDFERVFKLQFDALYRDGASNGTVLCLALHPYRIGQPGRIKYLDNILRYVLGHEGIWVTTGEEIARFYLANHYQKIIDHLQAYDRA